MKAKKHKGRGKRQGLRARGKNARTEAKRRRAEIIPTTPAPPPEPYDLPDGSPNPNAPDTVYS